MSKIVILGSGISGIGVSITTYQRFKMTNPIIQFFKFIYLSIKIMIVVAGGHGGTRKVN